MSIQTVYRDLASHKLGQLFHDRKPQTGAFDIAVLFFINTFESREQMRNVFLQGGLVKGSIEKQTDELFYLSLMLHKLSCIIILKRAGFEGYILNNPVLFNCRKAVESKERPLLKI